VLLRLLPIHSEREGRGEGEGQDTITRPELSVYEQQLMSVMCMCFSASFGAA
jgi:hypothetical protein